MDLYNSKMFFLIALLCLVILLVYQIILEVYLYILALIVLYVLYKTLMKKYTSKIENVGQGVFITGCDTGLGHDAALRLAKLGFTVYAGCLNPESEGATVLKKKGGERLHVIPLDVTSDESVNNALDTVRRYTADSGLWAVINNAAIQFVGDVEFARIEMMKRVAEVNYYGMVRVTKAFLPLIRKARGRVINVTSVKGRLALPTDVAYIAMKWAGEAFSDILRREMYRFGVKVIVIEPGHFGGLTDILRNDRLKLAEEELNTSWEEASLDVKEAYGREYIVSLIDGMRQIGVGGATSTDRVSDAMQDAVENENPKCRYLIHGTNMLRDKYCILAVLNGILPEVMSDYLVRFVFPLPSAAQQVR